MLPAILLGLLSPAAVLAQSSSAATPCTSTITELVPWGCTITVAGQTAQATMNCQGCSLTTTSSINALLGLGPVCIGGRKTVTNPTMVKTVTSCAPGTGPTAKKGKGRDEL